MIHKESVSFKDIFIEIEKLIKFLFSKWITIVIVAVIFAAAGLIYAIVKKPTYSATLNFVLSSNSTTGGGLLGLASQFGVNINNDNSDVFSGDNIIILMTSRRMVQQALFTKPENYNTTLLNIYIRDNEFNTAWDKKDRTKNAYPYPDDPAKMTLVQDSLFRSMYDDMQKNLLEVSKPNDNENIYEITTTSTNDTVSYYLTK